MDEMRLSPESRILVFVHWSPSDKMSEHDLNLIRTMSLEFDTVMIVRNLNKSKSTSLRESLPLNSFLVDRENTGYDFAAYKTALTTLASHKESISEIVLANNSVFLANNTLTETMARIRNSNFEVTALTSSWERQHHLQSYFIHFKKAILQNNSFWNWFMNLETSDEKQNTVDQLEIPLAQEIAVLGYRSGAIWDYQQVLDFYFAPQTSGIIQKFRREPSWIYGVRTLRSGEFLNPTHYMWPHLLLLNFPFLKKDLLQAQELSNLGVRLWEEFIDDENLKLLINSSILKK